MGRLDIPVPLDTFLIPIIRILGIALQILLIFICTVYIDQAVTLFHPLSAGDQVNKGPGVIAEDFHAVTDCGDRDSAGT